MSKKIILTFTVVLALGIWASKTLLKKSDTKSKTSAADLKANSHWTCPMHPQIHQDHAGECPICHMKLVQVRTQETQESRSTRAQVHPTADQLALIGVQKQQVEKMDLNVSVPVAGRFITSSNVAFQIYESDLPLIKPGLQFTGRSSFAAGEISGTITSVDSIVDPTSRTVRVIGRIESGPRGLVSETTFSGTVRRLLKNRIAVPESSVLHTGKSDLVYVFANENKLSPREVQLGAKSEGFYEVVSGLEAQEYISSGPNFLIDSEAKIRGSSEKANKEGRAATPECPSDQHWDIPMAMCMPGKATK